MYDLIYIADEDGTANLMTLKQLEIPMEIQNLCKVLGILHHKDHIGWRDVDTIAGIVEQCPALGIRVREISVSVFSYFQEKVNIEGAIEYALSGGDFEKIIKHNP